MICPEESRCFESPVSDVALSLTFRDLCWRSDLCVHDNFLTLCLFYFISQTTLQGWAMFTAFLLAVGRVFTDRSSMHCLNLAVVAVRELVEEECRL